MSRHRPQPVRPPPPASAPAAAAVAAALLLAACGGGGEDAPAPLAAVPAPATASAAAPPGDVPDPAVVAAEKDMVQAVTLGADSAPVDLRFELAEPPRAGQPFTLELAVLPQALMLSLRGAVTGDPGLEVVMPADGVRLGKLQAGSIHRFRVTALSASPGTRVVNVAMTLELPTGQATRTFGVPVVVLPAGSGPPRA